ncbi:hypothetical protein CCR75_007698 [Bremia lactucae]|uniref:Dihydroorotase n=1 Tax=Bremia lactucae TaxID=4779 RepID=A0A976IDZ0_BRELC|nr:hypothetical protein CCR75_007698 [Bremia lactucae]
MAGGNMPLLVHGEVTDPFVDLFDREATLIKQSLKPLVSRFPRLKIVMKHITNKEHITTKEQLISCYKPLPTLQTTAVVV